jgi:hypothetical protein
MLFLTPTRLQRAEHYFSNYAAVLPDGVSLDDALKPEFWAHAAGKLRQHDTIRLIPENGAFFAEVLVLSAGRGFVKVKLLHHIVIDQEGQSDGTDLVEVKWRGPHSKWSILRRSDGSVLKEGLVDKSDALREAADYTKIAA